LRLAPYAAAAFVAINRGYQDGFGVTNPPDHGWMHSCQSPVCEINEVVQNQTEMAADARRRATILGFSVDNIRAEPDGKREG
jgi:hypothetical protein